MVTECWPDLLMFWPRRQKWGETEAGNIEYICMQSLISHLHSLSLVSSPFVFCSLLHIREHLTNSHIWKHVWCVCMRVIIQVCTTGKMGSCCEVGTQMETLHGSVGQKPLVWVRHVFYCFPVEARETSRTGLPFVRVYTCMYLRMYINRCICMRVCGYGLSEDIWISRVSRVKKRAQDRYSEMDVCTQRLGLCKDSREQSINDIKCATY